MTQLPRVPDIEAQRAAMQKLDFLVGNWQGEARLQREPGAPMNLMQSEMAQYKLDGLILLIEGVGRSRSEGKIVLQAFATISYDDENGKYLMRAYNDGRYLETEIKLAEDGRGLAWGLVFGEIKTSSLLRITDDGAWTELGEIAIASQPRRTFLELTVWRVK
jgi:hypothetical protein